MTIASTSVQDGHFLNFVIDGSNLLNASVEWIASNFSPEDIFEEFILENWAIDNGFKKIRSREIGFKEIDAEA